MDVCRNKITCLKDVEYALRPLDNLIGENMSPLIFMRLHEGLVTLSKAARDQQFKSFELVKNWFELYVKVHKVICPRKRSPHMKFLKIMPLGVHIILQYLLLRPKCEDAYALLKMIETIVVNVTAGCVLELLRNKNLILYLWRIIADAGDFNTQTLVFRLMTMLLKCCDEQQRNMHLARISCSGTTDLLAELQTAIRFAADHVNQFDLISRSILNAYNKGTARMVYSFHCTSIELGQVLTFNKIIHNNEFWVDLNFCPRTLTFKGCCTLTCNQIIDVCLAVCKILFDGNTMTVHYKRPATFSRPLCDLEYLGYIGYATFTLPADELARLTQRDDMISYFNGENENFFRDLQTNRDSFCDDASSDLENIDLDVDETFFLGAQTQQRNEAGADHPLTDITNGTAVVPKPKRKYTRRTVPNKTPTTSSSDDTSRDHTSGNRNRTFTEHELRTGEVNASAIDPIRLASVAENSDVTFQENVQIPKPKRKYTRRAVQSKTPTTASKDGPKRVAKAKSSTVVNSNVEEIHLSSPLEVVMAANDDSDVLNSGNGHDNGGTASSNFSSFSLNEVAEGHFHIVEYIEDQSDTNNLGDNAGRPLQRLSTANEFPLSSSLNTSERPHWDNTELVSFSELIGQVFKYDDDDVSDVEHCRESSFVPPQDPVLTTPQNVDVSTIHNIPMEIPDNTTILTCMDTDVPYPISNASPENNATNGVNGLQYDNEISLNYADIEDLNQHATQATDLNISNELDIDKCHIEECMERFFSKLPREGQWAYERQVAATCKQMLVEYKRQRNEIQEIESNMEHIERELFKFCQSYDTKVKRFASFQQEIEKQFTYLASLRVARNAVKYFDELREELLGTKSEEIPEHPNKQ